MKSLLLQAPEFMFMVTTRAALAAGIGLLCATRMSAERRRMMGAALVAVGAVTTVPAVAMLLRGRRRSRRLERAAGVQFDARLIGATRFPRKGDDHEG